MSDLPANFTMAVTVQPAAAAAATTINAISSLTLGTPILVTGLDEDSAIGLTESNLGSLVDTGEVYRAGSVSASTHLNAVFAAAATTSRAVFFAEGTYILSSAIRVPSGTRAYALGRVILKAASGSTANPVLIEVAGKSNILFDGFEFNGSMPDLSGFNNVLTIYQSSDVVFRNCVVTNTRGVAALFQETSRSGFQDSRFKDCGILNRTTLSFADRRQAIAFSGSGAGNFAINNTFENVGLDCVSATNGQTGTRIFNNYIRSNDAGSIYVSQVVGAKVIGNDITNGAVGGNAIDCVGSSDFVIEGNVCIGNGAAGVLIAGDCVRGVVAGNVCKNNVQSTSATLHKGGITFHLVSGTAMRDVIVSGNVCDDTQGAGTTQLYAIGILNQGGTAQDIQISSNNRLVGRSASGALTETNAFQTNDLGVQPYPRVFNLAASGVFVLGPDTCRAQINVLNLTSGPAAIYLLRKSNTPLELLDTSAHYEATDTGTTTAIYRDTGDSTVKIKNRTADTISYMASANYIVGTA